MAEKKPKDVSPDAQKTEPVRTEVGADGLPVPPVPVPSVPDPDVTAALADLRTRVGGIETALTGLRDAVVKAPHRIVRLLTDIKFPWDE